MFLWAASGLALLVYLVIRKFFTCPPELSHLPRVPLRSLLLSFLSGETEDERTQRLIVPFQNERGHGVVVVWALGEWYVHVLNHKLGKELMENKHIHKQMPRTEMAFWKLTGMHNVVLTEGDVWKKQSRIVRNALHRNIPIDQFTALSHQLFHLMGDGGHIRWDDFTHRFTLDAVGTAVMGYDFQALLKPNGSFVQHYHEVMREISHPLYVAFPVLERCFPRFRLHRKIEAFKARFQQIVDLKRQDPGNDFVSYLLDQQDLSGKEVRDNIVTMFMAGHDTTAGALSTIVYYLAKYPQHQKRARAEVVCVLGDTSDPTVGDFENMPFLNACIRESLRLNGPSTITIPRISLVPTRLGPYTIPPNVPMALNLFAILHDGTTWPNPDQFDPERFMGTAQTDGEWLPFGTGSRRCPASNFSLYEQRTLTALLLRRFEWTLPAHSVHRDGIRNAFSTFALNLPKDMYIDFKLVRP